MVPMRSCIACRGRESSTDLLHLVVVSDRVTPDPKHVLPGRGAWLHLKCFELAVQRRSFNRAFRSDKDLQIQELETFIKSALIKAHQDPITKEQK